VLREILLADIEVNATIGGKYRVNKDNAHSGRLMMIKLSLLLLQVLSSLQFCVWTFWDVIIRTQLNSLEFVPNFQLYITTDTLKLSKVELSL
jgi:hypothetical protein